MNLLILRALETQLASVVPALPTAFENVTFTATPGVPYQRTDLLPAATVNPTLGDTMSRESGILQVTLCYPVGTGSGAARAQADLIRAAFPRGHSMTAGTTTVQIDSTPSVAAGLIVGDRYCLPVRIRYFANVFAGQ
jgi:hypothetical protein